MANLTIFNSAKGQVGPQKGYQQDRYFTHGKTPV
jgi:hypothetical protein